MEGTEIKQKRVEDHDVAEKHDFLAELPEHLLHHILSFLTMKDVIRTSVLAKRWKFMWKYVPCLTFSPLKKARSKEVAFINQSLLLHKGSIQKLNITLKYFHTEADILDSWMHFVSSRDDISELYLDFSRFDSRTFKYTLGDKIFCCSSLTILTVRSCMIKFPAKIKNSSLRTLSFEKVDFDSGALNNLLSSCSNLEDLSFTDCGWANNHDLAIMNSCVKNLKIQGGCFSQNSTLEINAPFIVSFESGGLFSKYYVIKRMESLRSASFVCSKPCSERDTHFTNLENLAYLCHVKDLRMCSCYIQAISSTWNATQDCREKHVIDLITFDVTCLRIKAGFMKSELPGIAYILSHSPNLQTLIISIEYVHRILGAEVTYNFPENEYWELQKPQFVNLLCNLKDVKIYNFLKNICLIGNNLAHLQNDMNFLRILLKNDMNFLIFLLKNCKAMERMTITTVKKVNLGRGSESKKSKLLFQLKTELLSFTGGSQAVEISFN